MWDNTLSIAQLRIAQCVEGYPLVGYKKQHVQLYKRVQLYKTKGEAELLVSAEEGTAPSLEL